MGKTIQTISLIVSDLHEDRKDKKMILVIAPTGECWHKVVLPLLSFVASCYRAVAKRILQVYQER